jgi:di/tricarboxylate transporter
MAHLRDKRPYLLALTLVLVTLAVLGGLLAIEVRLPGELPGLDSHIQVLGTSVTLQVAMLLLIIVLALILLSLEWVPVDVVSLGLLILLILTGLLPVDQAFTGFGSDTVIVIFGLFILTAALLRTGVVDMAGRAILRHTGKDVNRLLGVIMLASAGLGAFISNTASTAFFVPVVIGLAHRARVSASKLLMPLAFASILTSSVTLVSTSTNIVVSGLMAQYRLPPMGMFELAPVGLPIAVAGLIYMFAIGRRLIPDRVHPDDPADDFGVRQYLTETVVLPDSPLIGKTLAESGLGRDLDLVVLRVIRSKDRYLVPRSYIRLQAGDVLLVEGARDEILKIQDTVGIEIKAGEMDLQSEEMRLVEAILLPRSPLVGRTLRSYRFRERHGAQVLAVNRHGETIRRKISQIRLGIGDMLLAQGHPGNIAALDQAGIFTVINPVEENRPNRRRAHVAIAVFVGALAMAALNLVALPVAILTGVLFVFLTRCINPQEAYQEVEWRAIILIGSMLAVGQAMEYTGAAEFLAAQVVQALGGANPVWLLTAFFVLTVLLTQPMSNQAAAVVLVPVAIQTALQLDLNPRTFAMMIAVAASTSYLTPLEPACLMVYGPGRYRFVDFLKVGALLTLLIYLISIVLVPIVWPL